MSRTLKHYIPQVYATYMIPLSRFHVSLLVIRTMITEIIIQTTPKFGIPISDKVTCRDRNKY